MWPHQRSITPLVSLYLAYATPWVPSQQGGLCPVAGSRLEVDEHGLSGRLTCR